MADAVLSPANVSPSDAAANGAYEAARRGEQQVHIAGDLTTGTKLPRIMFHGPVRITRVRFFRGTAGGTGGSTDVDLNKNGTSILSAAVEIEQSGGDNQTVDASLDTAHDDYDGEGVVVDAGEYLNVAIDAIETGDAPANLTCFIDFIRG